MKLWIRLDVAVRSDPNVAEIAETLNLPFAEAVGLCTLVWCAIAEHRPSGDITGLSISQIERWAEYCPRKGKPAGSFGRIFLDIFVSDGAANGWHSRQGALIERAEKERARKRRGKSAEVPKKVASTERNGTEHTNTTTSGSGEPSRKPKVGKAPPKYPSFPKADSDRYFETCIASGHAVEMGYLRKAIAPLYATTGPAFPADDLNAAILAFLETREGQPPDKARFWTLMDFAKDVARWVRIGKMPLVDMNGVTERGRLAAGL